MAHKELTCKGDFDYALETAGQYVLVYAHRGEVSPQAEAYAKRYSETTDAYKVDVDKYPTAKAYFEVEATPCIMVYKSGKQMAKVEQMGPDNMNEIHEMLSAST